MFTLDLLKPSRLSRGHKCNGSARGLGFNSWIGKVVLGLCRFFEKFTVVAQILELYSTIWQ